MLAVLGVSVSATAQDRPAQVAATTVASACSTPTKGLEKSARKHAELMCELENAQLQRQIRDIDTKPEVPGIIGVAAKNKAVTTVTYRGADGTAFEGSKEWAKHEEKMAKIANPSNPCDSWLMAPSYCYANLNGNYGGVARVNGYGFPARVNGYAGRVYYNPPPPPLPQRQPQQQPQPQQPPSARVCGYRGC